MVTVKAMVVLIAIVVCMLIMTDAMIVIVMVIVMVTIRTIAITIQMIAMIVSLTITCHAKSSQDNAAAHLPFLHDNMITVWWYAAA